MDNINQTCGNNSAPSKASSDVKEKPGGAGKAKGKSDGWVRPTCPWTPPNPGCGFIKKNKINTPATLVTLPTTGLIVFVTGKVGVAPVIDNAVNVKLTITITYDNNNQYVKTYLLYKGSTLLVQQHGQRLVYVTVE